MAKADFLRTEILDRTDQTKSIAVISITDDKDFSWEARVEFWFSILSQYSKEDVKTLICADGLAQAGFVADARKIIAVGASGTLTKDENGASVDTRNWRQNWLDAHPLPPETITPDNDPLL